MNNQKRVTSLLQECKQMLDQLSQELDLPKGNKSEHQQYGALLPDDLKTLIKEAKEMKWPFVPERWQYKQAIGLEDKINLQDMITARLHDLLISLKTSIAVRDYVTAAAIVFLIDRFLYWVDGSSQLLQIAKRLHKLRPTTPIAPQLVIRQARVSVNSGKLLKAEYILSSLINNNGATGVWKYAKESDRILVQAVCIQIRGQILQKLGMWYEAAELIWASILGYFTLPQPDKKGIATSLGILADIFVSMNENDYNRFKNNYQFDLNLLKEFDHRLLSAAEACKLAAAFSQFTSLFVLTAMNIRGTCLLSYSCSSACPSEKQKFYLSEAKESFEIGILSKKDKEPVTSKQELHSFVKAAFCLTKVHQRLYGESERLTWVNQLCQDVLKKLYIYNHSTHSGQQDREQLAEDIMGLVMSVKEQLHVQSFPNSDVKSYIPDSYKMGVDKQIISGELSFETVLKIHSQHHEAVCEVFESACKSQKVRSGEGKTGICITALETETRNLDTVCTMEEISHHGSDAVKIPLPQKARKNHEACKGQIRKRLSHGAAVDYSFDEKTECESEERSKKSVDGISGSSQSRSEISSSLRSWSKFSQSSSSSSGWEEIGCEESKLPHDNIQNKKASTEEGQVCSADLNEDALSNVTELELNSRHLGKIIDSAKQPHIKTSSTNSKCSNESLSLVTKLSSEQDQFEIIISSSAADSRTKDSSKNSGGTSNHNQCSVGNENGEVPESYKQIPELVARPLVDPEGETVELIEDAQMNLHLPNDRMTLTSINSNMLKPERDHFVLNWINKSTSTVPKTGSFEIPAVDPQAETAEEWECAFDSARRSADHLTDIDLIRNQQNHRPGTISSPSEMDNKPSSQSSYCATTEEGEGEHEHEKLSNILSLSHSSGSSLKSWYKTPNFSSSFSDMGSPSYLNSSGSSFFFMERTKDHILQARILSDDDYARLLSGVDHTWLVERMKNTGLYKPSLLHKGYSALLLKYSKKSGQWTAQETAAYIGDYLSVAKKGRQRDAFWIHFLHQEEILGRYVGKEYKDEKELVHHFSDVERQMTAQYYVTEFNKRLYEQKVHTQIFYIPSVVLLLLEGKSIQGCVSVEPYILGEFVKLSNNTKIVKLEYKATEYGLAYGHFCYDFSQGTDVVVDLQGWVTGNGKGLIYLTDPQIHSVSQKEASCLTNFGKKGIYYFFNSQHTECNDICRRLSLTRPSVEKPN
ncbi:alpha-protein kinase 1 [Sceloporus undulatus]|uniref:alpha-protein kinase 1 n=1 Tax=Sceloporus undulatus TaxID=8520 RepID=UPI001C4B6E4C|nr:alpha-protein kinase 1 [Sceloporus undulatus]